MFIQQVVVCHIQRTSLTNLPRAKAQVDWFWKRREGIQWLKPIKAWRKCGPWPWESWAGNGEADGQVEGSPSEDGGRWRIIRQKWVEIVASCEQMKTLSAATKATLFMRKNLQHEAGSAKGRGICQWSRHHRPRGRWWKETRKRRGVSIDLARFIYFDY